MIVKYCTQCGSKVTEKVPEGDVRVRFICEQCHFVHYQNPKIVTGCIVEWEQKILLCRRAINPRHGLWTVPAGFMENGETTYQGAMRETLEEANARVELLGPYLTINLPKISQVYLLFRARLLDLDFSPGIESLETVLFDETDIPWEQLAFPTVAASLRYYFADRSAGHFIPRMADITEGADDLSTYRVRVIPSV